MYFALTISVGLYLALAGQGPFDGFNEVGRLSSLLGRRFGNIRGIFREAEVLLGQGA